MPKSLEQILEANDIVVFYAIKNIFESSNNRNLSHVLKYKHEYFDSIVDNLFDELDFSQNEKNEIINQIICHFTNQIKSEDVFDNRCALLRILFGLLNNCLQKQTISFQNLKKCFDIILADTDKLQIKKLFELLLNQKKCDKINFIDFSNIEQIFKENLNDNLEIEGQTKIQSQNENLEMKRRKVDDKNVSKKNDSNVHETISLIDEEDNNFIASDSKFPVRKPEEQESKLLKNLENAIAKIKKDKNNEQNHEMENENEQSDDSQEFKCESSCDDENSNYDKFSQSQFQRDIYEIQSENVEMVKKVRYYKAEALKLIDKIGFQSDLHSNRDRTLAPKLIKILEEMHNETLKIRDEVKDELNKAVELIESELLKMRHNIQPFYRNKIEKIQPNKIKFVTGKSSVCSYYQSNTCKFKNEDYKCYNFHNKKMVSDKNFHSIIVSLEKQCSILAVNLSKMFAGDKSIISWSNILKKAIEQLDNLSFPISNDVYRRRHRALTRRFYFIIKEHLEKFDSEFQNQIKNMPLYLKFDDVLDVLDGSDDEREKNACDNDKNSIFNEKTRLSSEMNNGIKDNASKVNTTGQIGRERNFKRGSRFRGRGRGRNFTKFMRFQRQNMTQKRET